MSSSYIPVMQTWSMQALVIIYDNVNTCNCCSYNYFAFIQITLAIICIAVALFWLFCNSNHELFNWWRQLGTMLLTVYSTLKSFYLFILHVTLFRVHFGFAKIFMQAKLLNGLIHYFIKCNIIGDLQFTLAVATSIRAIFGGLFSPSGVCCWVHVRETLLYFAEFALLCT